MNRKDQISMKTLLGLCKRIEDPRRRWGNKRHELTDVLVIALLAIICNCENWEEIRDYGRTKREWLRTFLPLSGGIPSESTFRRVFAMLLPESLEQVYRQWVMPYIGSCLGKQICIDGKTNCGVRKRSNRTLHMVSAWVREDGLSLGQVRTEEKSNEITAIPALLDTLSIAGGVVTIDAMGCQKEIAARIVQGEEQYVLAVKENHPTLYAEMKEYFDWAGEDPIEQRHLSEYKETVFDHGRTTKWHVTSTTDTVWFEDKGDWPGLRSFVRVACVRDEKGQQQRLERFYISSLQADASAYHRYIRGHWSIENQLHWMLDVAFHEDQSLVNEGHAPQNLSLLRKMALFLLKADSSVNASIARKRKIAGWDNAFAFSLFGLA